MTARKLKTFEEKINAFLRGVTGLTQVQLTVCKTKGAIIDEDAATNTS